MQTRWLCGACGREWVFAYGWTDAQGCPACHSAAITQQTYLPEFPGADVPRVAVPPTAARDVPDWPPADADAVAQLNHLLSLVHA